MPWEYSQSTGQLKHDGALIGTGYSGAGTTAATGRNNPAMQHVVDAGPIPQGQWSIGPAYQHPTHGPTVMNLTPVGHNALGRTAFQIHGNNPTNNASHGCIIMGPAIRSQIAASGDATLSVVP
jgi:hypothetical protein